VSFFRGVTAGRVIGSVLSVLRLSSASRLQDRGVDNRCNLVQLFQKTQSSRRKGSKAARLPEGWMKPNRCSKGLDACGSEEIPILWHKKHVSS